MLTLSFRHYCANTRHHGDQLACSLSFQLFQWCPEAILSCLACSWFDPSPTKGPGISCLCGPPMERQTGKVGGSSTCSKPDGASTHAKSIQSKPATIMARNQAQVSSMDKLFLSSSFSFCSSFLRPTRCSSSCLHICSVAKLAAILSMITASHSSCPFQSSCSFVHRWQQQAVCDGLTLKKKKKTVDSFSM